jgi:hypothetical protein
MSSYLKGVFSTTPASSAYVPPTIGAAPAMSVVKKKKATKVGFGSVCRPTENSSVSGSRLEDDRISVADSQPTIECADLFKPTIETPETAVTPEVEESKISEQRCIEVAEIEESIPDRPIEECGDEVVVEPPPTSTDQITPLITTLADLVGAYTEQSIRQSKLREEKTTIEFSIAQLVSEQNDFCEAENFDSADKLNAEIDTLRNKLVDVISELYSEIPKKMNELRNEQQLIMDKISSQGEQQLNDLLAEKRDAESLFETTSKNLRSKMESMAEVDGLFAQQEEDIDARKCVLRNRQDEVEHLIGEESEKLEKEKTQAEDEYNRLDELIVDLQAQLAAAMAARSDCAMTISASDLKLKNIRAKFSNVLEELDDEQFQIEEETKDLLDAKIAAGGGDVKSVQAQIDSTSSSHSKEIEDLMTRESLLISQKDEVGKFFEALIEFTTCIPSATDYEEFVSACEYTRFLNDAVVELELELSNFKLSLISARETELPALEAAKKMAVSNRAFRDAKEIAEEIKRISDELDSANERQNELKTKLVSARAELQEARNVEEKMRAEIAEIESKLVSKSKDAETKFFDQISSLQESQSCQLLIQKVTPIDYVSE